MIQLLLFHSRNIARSFAGIAVILASLTVAASAAPNTLRIYFVDVEGGQATLFVTPTGQSLLIDSGWPGNDGRDADRIVATAKQAGLSKIDFVLLTHFHTDHAGGAPQLAARIPIGTFIDHGDNREATDAPTVDAWHAYQQLLATKKYQRLTVKPGDELPISGIGAKVVSADGAVLDKPLEGAGKPNPACQDAPVATPDQTENVRSLGVILTFGKLRILDLGDLTMDKELQLMCPVNKIGKVDIYIVSHHGWSQSGSVPFVYGIEPRIAIMDNGAKKGGTPSTWDTLRKVPTLEDLWQLHFSEEGAAAHNSPAEFIANPDGPDAAHSLRLTAHPDGRFEVFNSRTEKTKRYPAH